MKKGDILLVEFDKLDKLNTALSYPIENNTHSSSKDIITPQTQIKVKNVIPGKKGLIKITKKKRKKIEGQLINYEDLVLPDCELCNNPVNCGGCTFNLITPEEELQIKENYLKELFQDYPFEGLSDVEHNRKYRNKMEYSFGNQEKDGELTLGLHEKGKFYNILNTDNCQLVPNDFETIRKAVLDYFIEKETDFFHKHTHHGFLRYLVLRRGERTGDVLINLVTTSEENLDEKEFVNHLENLNLEGKISGILWTISDNVADAVNPESEKILYGSKIFNDEILGKEFMITPYSFFQVNTSGADQLFSIVRDYLENITKNRDSTILFDLYSGTGSIGILLSDLVDKVISIELIEEAVEIAKENAKLNDITNIEFISGDVLKKVDELDIKPDVIILDPPRYGITPKALKKILNFNPEYFIYVSCNPVELRKDLEMFKEKGYRVDKMESVNLFPMTTNVETVCLLSKIN